MNVRNGAKEKESEIFFDSDVESSEDDAEALEGLRQNDNVHTSDEEGTEQKKKNEPYEFTLMGKK